MRKLLLVLLLLLSALSFAWSATLHVSKTGSDSNDCSVGFQCLTIAHGTSVMAGGDTLIVHVGTYTEGNIVLTSGSVGAPTTIQAASGDIVTVFSPGIGTDCLILIKPTNQYVVVDGLILDGNSLTGFPVCIDGATTPTQFPTNITIQNNEIKNGRSSGMLLEGAQWTVRNNNIHHNALPQTSSPYGHGVYWEISDGVFEGNTVHDNQCWGLQNFSSAGFTPQNNTFTKNIFYGNGCGGMTVLVGGGHLIANNIFHSHTGFAQGGPGTNNTLSVGIQMHAYNNTFYNNTGAGIILCCGASDSSSWRIQNNIVYLSGGITGFSNAVVSNNLTTDPGFVNAGAADFHLSASSPAIDIGITLTEVAVDISGIVRPQGVAYDIGAYEFVSSPIKSQRVVRNSSGG